MSLTPGSTLGPYTITAELGHGGMGVVYTAQDPRLKRQVAIKLLTPDLTRDETAMQRFLQEAQAASGDVRSRASGGASMWASRLTLSYQRASVPTMSRLLVAAAPRSLNNVGCDGALSLHRAPVGSTRTWLLR